MYSKNISIDEKQQQQVHATMKSSSDSSHDDNDAGCEIHYYDRNTNSQASNQLDESFDGEQSDKPIMKNKQYDSSGCSTNDNTHRINQHHKKNRMYTSRRQNQNNEGANATMLQSIRPTMPLRRSVSDQRRTTRRGIIITCLFMILIIVIVTLVAYTMIAKNHQGSVNNNNNSNSNTSPSNDATKTVIPTTSPTVGDGTMKCNGYENLCDIPVNDIFFATVHNAGSTTEDGVLVLPNHQYHFTKALEAGYRGINFDIGKCADGSIRFIHATCLLATLDPVETFQEIITFLSDHPHEVILMPIQIENAAEGGVVTIDEIYQVLQSVNGLPDLLYTFPTKGNSTTTNKTHTSRELQNTDNGTWPTLRELIEQDRRIIWMHYDATQRCSELSDGKCPPGMNEWFSYAAETQFQFTSIDDIENKTYACELTRGYDPERNESYYVGANIFLEIPSESNCFITNAQDFLTNHLQQCTTYNGGRTPNVAFVDCWNIGDVVEVIQTFNEQLDPTKYVQPTLPVTILNSTAAPSSAAGTSTFQPSATPPGTMLPTSPKTDVPTVTLTLPPTMTPTISLTNADAVAEVFVSFDNVTSEITDDNNFEQVCTNYFDHELNTTLNNIQCSILSQSIQSSSARRYDQRRMVQTSSLQMILQVIGQPKRIIAPQQINSTLTSLVLKSVMEETGIIFLKELKSSTSNRTKRTFLPATNITVQDVSEGATTVAPTTISTVPPTISPVAPSPTVMPSFSEENSTVCSIEPQRTLQLDDSNGIGLKAYTNAIDNTITVQMIYNGIGWIGISFVETNAMIPAIAMIGLPESESVNKYLMLSKSIDGISSDAVNQTLMNTSIVQNETHTVMTFTKYLSERDDVVSIPLTGMMIVNYAIGCSNDFNATPHCVYGSGSFVNVAPCHMGDDNNNNSTDTAPSPSVTDHTLYCNGLENLCDIPAHKVMYASVHNAQASVQDGFVIFPNQQKDLEEALAAGYRSLNIDFGVCNGALGLVHSYCALGVKDPYATFTDIVSFLNNNPNEVILITVQIDNGLEGDVTNDIIDSVFQTVTGLYDMMYQHPNKTTEWPTLRTLIESNQRIVYFQYNSDFPCTDSTTGAPNGQCPHGFHDWFVYAVENQYQFDTVSAITNNVSYSCELTRGDVDHITTETGQRPNIFFGLNIFTMIPSEANCAITNQQQFLLSIMAACKNINSFLQPNVIFIDCWDIGNLLNVTNDYNAKLSSS